MLPAFAWGLASKLIDVFAPLAHEKITKAVAKVTDSTQVQQQIADTVIGAAKSLTGQADPVQAVAAVMSQPALIAQVETSALDTLDKLLPLIERVDAAERAAWQDTERARADAHARNADEPMLIDTPWIKLRFIHLLSIGLVGFSGWFVNKYWPSLTPELKGTVITLMVVAGWNGVKDYWMGSSRQSAAKDTLNAELARRK